MFPCLNEKLEILEFKKKKFIKQKILNNIEVSSSKQVYVTNSCVKDAKARRRIEIKMPLHRNF